ncbi:MAG: DUF1295 domain-containing protein [Devosia sp.]
MPDLLFANMPWAHLGIAFALCLAISALGFRRVDWFISLGYGFSIAAQAVLFALLYRATLDFWLMAQLLLLAAYGLRLSGFLIMREASPSFTRELEASKARSAGINSGAKLAIWLSVSALYVTMASPALFSLSSASIGASVPSLAIGVVIMVLGLALETAADAQKARLKAANPSRFVSTGLFAIVRSPNYFGEMLFWFGAFASGIAAYHSVLNWLVALTGLVCIELIMLGSARRLELKQAERYGTDAAYQNYVRRVPVLIPLLPIHSLKALKIYLG